MKIWGRKENSGCDEESIFGFKNHYLYRWKYSVDRITASLRHIFLCFSFLISIYKREKLYQSIKTLKSLSIMTELWILVIILKRKVAMIFKCKRIMGENINCLYTKIFQIVSIKRNSLSIVFLSLLLLSFKKVCYFESTQLFIAINEEVAMSHPFEVHLMSPLSYINYFVYVQTREINFGS